MTPFFANSWVGCAVPRGVVCDPACLVLRRTSVSCNSFPRVILLNVAQAGLRAPSTYQDGRSPIVLGSCVLGVVFEWCPRVSPRPTRQDVLRPPHLVEYSLLSPEPTQSFPFRDSSERPQLITGQNCHVSAQGPNNSLIATRIPTRSISVCPQ